MSRRLIFILSLCMTQVFATPQLQFKKISVGDGLTQNTITALFQDRLGYLWIGTQDGLSLYNGSSFRHFKNNPSDSTTLSDNFIIDIYQDANEQIWIATRNGLNLFDKKTFQFRRFYGMSYTTRKYHNTFTRIAGINNDFVIIQKAGFLIGHTSTFTFYPIQNIIHKYFRNIQLQRLFPYQGGFMVTSNRGLIIFDQKTYFSFIPIRLRDGEIITSVMKWENDDEIWIGSTHGLYTAKKNSLNKKPLISFWENKSRYRISCMEEVDSVTCWIGSENGLLITNKNYPDKPMHIHPESKYREGISSENINNILKAKDGLIWVGTINAGLNIFDPQTNRFHIIELDTNANSSRINTAWGLFQEDDKKLLVGNNDGLQLIQFNRPIKEIANGQAMNWQYNMQSLKENDLRTLITFIHGDSSNYWLATNGNGLIQYDYLKKKLTRYTDQPKAPSIASNYIHHISGNDHILWLSTQNGITRFNPVLNQYDNIKISDYSAELNDFILSTYISKDNKLLLACSVNGLYIKDLQNGKVSVYQHNDTIPESLSFNITTSACEDEQGYFWIATLGGGINRFNPKEAHLEHFGQEKGLLDEVVYTLVPDHLGNIWFSSNTTIGKINTATLNLRVFLINDIFSGVEFSQNSYHFSKDGILFFGGTRGVVFFDPVQFQNKELAERIVLSDLRLNYRLLQPSDTAFIVGNPLMPDQINMKPGIRSLYADFSVLDYRNQANIQFSYMLDGLTDQWIELPKKQHAVFLSNLPFGDYVLKVKYRLQGESWFSVGLQIPIHVIPPFYQTLWFKVCVSIFIIISIGLSIYFISTQRLKRRLRKVEMEAKIQTERNRISRELHDNIGSQLTYVISSIDKISYRLKPETATDEKKKLDNLGDFTRQTMKELRETIHTLHKKQYALSELTEKIKELAGSYMSNTDTIIEINKSDNPLYTLTPIAFIHLYRVVQEALQNILKYASASKIIIHISVQSQELKLQIQDNGKGFEIEKVIRGNGLRNMQQRILELNGVIGIESKPGNGTYITITVPLQDEA